MEDIGDVLELSCSLLEAHCRVFGLRDFMAPVFQNCHENGRRDVQGLPLAEHGTQLLTGAGAGLT